MAVEKFNKDIINNNIESILTSHVIAIRLNLAESTIRKYAALLEKNGYIFSRNISGDRQFTLADEQALAEIIRLKKDSGIVLDTACKIVASNQQDNGEAPTVSKEVMEMAKDDMQLRAFAEMQRRFLEESNQMRETILTEVRKSLPDPAVAEENEKLKKEVSEMREALARNTELVNKLLAEKTTSTAEPQKPFWKKWLS